MTEHPPAIACDPGSLALDAPLVASINTAALGLTPTERARVRDFLEWYKEREAEAVKGPFRFLDLPAEARNAIYSFSFPTYATSLNLAKHALPVVARVSRQLRRESLPLFFAETPFHIVINSNFADVYIARKRAEGVQLTDWRHRPAARSAVVRCGVLGMKKHVRKAINRARGGALFRNVTFKVCWSEHGGTNKDQTLDQMVTTFIFMRFGRDGLVTEVEYGDQHPSSPDKSYIWSVEQFESKDVDDILAKAEDEIEAVENRPGFNGFTLNDLEAIAKTFRFVESQYHVHHV